jgi:hypothetical protein
MLKGRLKILLKRIDISLCYMLDLVMACICLNNMCIANSNGCYMDWILEAKKEMQIKTNSMFDNIKGVHMFKVVVDKNETNEEDTLIIYYP